jgi:hypothetical protein
MLFIDEMKYKWGLACVCIPRESFYWLEDWTNHYVKLGADVITIYDNTGSTCGSPARKASVYYKGDIQKKGLSKRNEPYAELTKHISDEEISKILDNISKKYEGIVNIVKWQNKNENGEIMHCQVEAYADFCRKNKNNLDYVTFFDMDEYLWFNPGHTIQKLFKQMNNNDVDFVILNQRRFKKRWNKNGPEDIKQHKEFTHQNATKWIAKMKNLTGVNIHFGCSFSKEVNFKYISPECVSYNHYNANGFNKNDKIMIDKNPYLFFDSQEDLSEIKWNDLDIKLGNEWGINAMML